MIREAMADPWFALLEIGAAVQVALDHLHLWGPPLLTVSVLTVAVRTRPNAVRARVRTVSALVRLDADPEPPTCTDTCPDRVADTRPDVSGPRLSGGS